MSGIPTVAIACQGGGSHAAFVAGVLDALLDDEHYPHFHIVGLSGTSGGALCAALAWRGLVKDDPQDGRKRLIGFWKDLMVHDPIDAIANYWHVWSSRAPVKMEVSPYLHAPLAETRLRSLLGRYLQLDELRAEPNQQTEPVLLVGATDILNGDRVVFRGESLSYDSLLASAAVPPLFRAVHSGGRLYWDGLLTTNPPIREFTELGRDQVPDEVWVIQVNPQQRQQEPRTINGIIDRSNELAGNLSLGQELFFLDKINGLIDKYPPLAERYKRIRIRVVALQDETLDLASKYDRRPDVIERLLERGRQRASDFFQSQSEWPRPDTIPCKSVYVAPAQPKTVAIKPQVRPRDAGKNGRRRPRIEN